MGNTSTNRSLGTSLRELRETLGLTLSQVGRRAGLSAQLSINAEADASMLSTAMTYARGMNRRVHFAVVRDRKARVLDLASEAGLSIEATYKALAVIADPSKAYGESDVTVGTISKLVAAMGGTIQILRTR